MTDFLMETALLTHGLPSISNQQILTLWPDCEAKLVWLENGEIIIGAIEEYLPLRERADSLKRIDAATLADAIKQKVTAAMTASAAMQVCADRGIPLAVTCGMGGIGPHPFRDIGADLYALAQLPVGLVASAPKDVFDLPATIIWLQQNGVKVIGVQADYCDGFLAAQPQVALDGTLDTAQLSLSLLILNGLEQKIVQQDQLEEAMAFGIQIQQRGGLYHPAVNNKLDELTEGKSSTMQLQGLIDNAKLAAGLKI